MQNSWCERPLMSQTDLKIWIWTQLCSIIILAVTFWPNVGVCGVLYIEALWVCFACWTYFNVYMKCYNIMLFVKIYTIYKKKNKKNHHSNQPNEKISCLSRLQHVRYNTCNWKLSLVWIQWALYYSLRPQQGHPGVCWLPEQHIYSLYSLVKIAFRG